MQGRTAGGDVSSAPEAVPRITLTASDVWLEYRVPVVQSPTAKRHWRSKTVLKGMSFAAREGEMIGFVGLNGSGKSSFLRVLAGLEPPTRGSVMAAAQPQLLGVSAALLPDLSGAENITIGALAMGLSMDEADAIRQDVEELADIGRAIRRPLRTYSSGMRARLLFAISVSAAPEILMIDEALATGDAAFSRRAKTAMDGLLAKAGTVFLVSHARRQVEKICTRAVWIHEGSIIADGPARHVASRYGAFSTKLGQNEPDEAARVMREAQEAFPPEFPQGGSLE